MGRGGGVAHDGDKGRDKQPKPGDGSDGPASVLGLDGLAVGDGGLQTGQLVCPLGVGVVVDRDLDVGVQVGDGVSDAGDVLGDVAGDLLRTLDLDSARVQGTDGLDVQGTEVEGLLDRVDPVDDDLNVGKDVPCNGTGPVDVEHRSVVVWIEVHLEEFGGELRVLHTRQEIVGLNILERMCRRGHQGHHGPPEKVQPDHC